MVVCEKTEDCVCIHDMRVHGLFFGQLRRIKLGMRNVMRDERRKWTRFLRPRVDGMNSNYDTNSFIYSSFKEQINIHFII